MTEIIAPLSTFGSVFAGADYCGLQMVKFWFNNRLHQVLVGSENCEKLRETYNGSVEDFERDCVSRIGTASYEDQSAPSEDVVAFLNQWRQANHRNRVARLMSHPERYGFLTEDDIEPAPPVLVPALYEQGRGWVKTQDLEEARLMAGL
ncbi:hypothetical protein [Metapseudomonas otitidis]|uniref:hypothetical protein n=1 Tax=Metapseudomonas otitidis TaxID=319939 RepID=UPI0013F5EF6D|nr:hypothetical protein [Pseudomonas otitidis]